MDSKRLTGKKNWDEAFWFQQFPKSFEFVHIIDGHVTEILEDFGIDRVRHRSSLKGKNLEGNERDPCLIRRVVTKHSRLKGIKSRTCKSVPRKVPIFRIGEGFGFGDWLYTRSWGRPAWRDFSPS